MKNSSYRLVDTFCFPVDKNTTESDMIEIARSLENYNFKVKYTVGSGVEGMVVVQVWGEI
jgi:hypothetical protein